MHTQAVNRNRSALWPICWAALALILGGCTLSTNPPTSTVMAPITVTHTITQTVTALPSLIPTPPPLPTDIPPTPSRTPWQITQIPWAWASPTPLATPPNEAAAYRLRAWNEQAALELVNTMEQYSYADNIMTGFEYVLEYSENQSPIKLTAQEVLLRYPDTQSKQKLEWRIALADAIQNSPSSDRWILEQLESGLNSAQYTLESLDELLNPNGFAVKHLQVAPNLLGDGQESWMIAISRLNDSSTGLYAAISQNASGDYIFTPIFSAWYSNKIVRGFPLEDHTGDNIPEVILLIETSNGSYCWGDLMIFEWQEDHFADLSRGVFYLELCNSRPTEWEYVEGTSNIAQPLLIREAASYYSTTILKQWHLFNGKYYELVKTDVEPPENWQALSHEWIFHATQVGDYALIATSLQQVLSADIPPDIRENEPAIQDHARFQLGLAYALRSQDSDVITTLQQLIEHPSNPQLAVLSSAAQSYLVNYSGDESVYRACQAALDVMEKAAIACYQQERPDSECLKQIWGYEPSVGTNSTSVCSLRAAFDHLTQELKAEEFDQAPELLEAAGVSIRSRLQADLNNDGQMEWILLTETPADDAAIDIWVLVNREDGIHSYPAIDSWNRGQRIPRGDFPQDPITVETVHSPEGKTISLIKIYHYLIAFVLADDRLIRADEVFWLYGRDIQSYETRVTESSLELELVYSTDTCLNCSLLYDWSDGEFRAVSYPEYDWPLAVRQAKEKFMQAEALSLDQWQPAEAIPLLQEALKGGDEMDTPRILYLLGLANELLGDERNAVSNYWHAWHDYPDSPYALMAQAKLEYAEK